MSSAPTTPDVCAFYQYQTTNGTAAANRLLFGWLSNDAQREALYADMVSNQSALHFTSNASRRKDQDDKRDYDWIDGPRDYEQPAVLLVHPDHIKRALTQSSELVGDENEAQTKAKLEYSNSPFQGLGGFSLLSLDDPKEHDLQRDIALDLLGGITDEQFSALSTLAFKAGSVTSLKGHDFDLTAMAENIAVRYIAMAFGFAQKDVALIEACTRSIGKGLQYQMMGRHFVFEPATMPECRSALAQLAKRATEIMQFYVDGFPLTRTDEDDKEEVETDRKRLWDYEFQIDAFGTKQKSLREFTPLIQKMASFTETNAHRPVHYGLVEKGLIAAGLVGGAVTNIQNAICLCLAEFFKQGATNMYDFKQRAIDERTKNPDAQWLPSSLLLDHVKEALRINPPATFIPRRVNDQLIVLNPNTTSKCPEPYDIIQPNTLVLIGMGGASWLPAEDANKKSNRFRNSLNTTSPQSPVNLIDSKENSGCPFARIFGGPPALRKSNENPPTSSTRWAFTHACPGMMMSMHLIYYVVRQLLLLPSLSQKINPDTGAPYGLEKRWGFQSTYYPLSYQRDMLLAQTPLQTILPIKTPIDFHSTELRRVIRLGAPFIEKVIGEAKIVHFATFVFLENDSKLGLFTMYDGDFDSYIGHFAKEFGHLFDRFFSHIAIQPPMPIRDHPFEFVQYLKQFSLPPVEGYYFSAYPETTADKISCHFKRQYDFSTVRGKP